MTEFDPASHNFAALSNLATLPTLPTLPPGLLLSYYGDDFTGSTDVMEACTTAGVHTVLFLQTPTAEWLARFPDARCVGLAGTARGQSPAWMDAHLPPAFQALAALGAPVLQYKVCSTFDSSPTVGSIGRAIELGTACMPGHWSPMVVGAPRLKRYQAFGHLFAVADGQGHRLDRHPTMSRHPVTPMAESDLQRHLAAQTSRRSALIDFTHSKTGVAEARLKSLLTEGAAAPVVLIDVLDDDTLVHAGRLVWQQRGQGIFSASSSGLPYALVAYWRSEGYLPAQPPALSAPAVAAIAVVSGSCSPATAAQITWASQHGFETHRLAIDQVLNATTAPAEIARLVAAALATLANGQSPLIYSAQGPDDPAVLGFATLAQQRGLSAQAAAQQVSAALAVVMATLLDCSPLRRIAVAGGDTAGEVTTRLQLNALTILAPLAPGAPLCKAWSAVPARDGLEIVLKGGQMGEVGFFGTVRQGAS